MPIAFDKYAADTHILDANRAYAKKVAELTLEVGRLRSGNWTDEERKLFLFEATKASYAEGVRAGCEELSIHAADMDVELEHLREKLGRALQLLDREGISLGEEADD